jgi:hypothetical protein
MLDHSWAGYRTLFGNVADDEYCDLILFGKLDDATDALAQFR